MEKEFKIGDILNAINSISKIERKKGKTIEIKIDSADENDIFSLNKDNLNVSIESFINNLNQLKSTVNKDPESVHALLVDLKNFKEENY